MVYNKESKRIYDKIYHEINKERIKIYLQTHKERRRKTKKAWDKKNREHIKRYKIQDYLKNKYRYNKTQREKYKQNSEQILLLNKERLKRMGVELNMNFLKYHVVSQLWSKAIKERDGKCQICKSEENLNAHHIFYKAKYPKLSLNMNNGITLCKKCHGKTHGFNTLILHN